MPWATRSKMHFCRAYWSISRHGGPLVIHGEGPAGGDGDYMPSAPLRPERGGMPGPPYWLR